MAVNQNPDTTPEEGDVKVPIDDTNDEAQEAAAEQAAPSGVESEIPGFADMTPEEQAKVRAAYESADKKAGLQGQRRQVADRARPAAAAA